MNLIIEQMNLNHLETISDILHSDFDNFWTVQTFKQELENSNTYYIVAKIDNEIVGFGGEVNEKNINAIKLYEKFGFKKIGLRKKYYNNIDNAILMKKNI